MRVFPSTFTSVRLLIDYRPAQLDTQASKKKGFFFKENKTKQITVSHNDKDINLQLKRQYLQHPCTRQQRWPAFSHQ